VLDLVHPVGATSGAHLDLAVTPDFTSGPVDSLEVRWVVPGPLAPEMRSWLARFPVTAEAREDRYLVQPRLPGLSVKLWTSLGFEARGAPALLRDALERAVGLVFAVAPPPAGSGFTEDNSLSFARWLREQRPCGPTPAL
jgi:hypothetical protein